MVIKKAMKISKIWMQKGIKAQLQVWAKQMEEKRDPPKKKINLMKTSNLIVSKSTDDRLCKITNYL